MGRFSNLVAGEAMRTVFGLQLAVSSGFTGLIVESDHPLLSQAL